MSLDASRWAWQQQLKLSDKMLLLALADRAGADNTSWPSYETLQQDTGMHRNTISGAIKRLEELGLITKTRRMKTSSLYQLIGVPDRHENTPKYTSGRNKDKGNLGSTNTVLKGSTKSVLNPVQKAYEGSHSFGTGTYQEPTTKENLSLNPMSANADDAVFDVFNYWVSVMGKTTSTQFTAERRKKVTARLANYTVDQIKAAIDGCKRSPHHQGANGTVYDDLELICRNDTKLEMFIGIQAPQITYSSDPKVNKNIETSLEWARSRA